MYYYARRLWNLIILALSRRTKIRKVHGESAPDKVLYIYYFDQVLRGHTPLFYLAYMQRYDVLVFYFVQSDIRVGYTFRLLLHITEKRAASVETKTEIDIIFVTRQPRSAIVIFVWRLYTRTIKSIYKGRRYTKLGRSNSGVYRGDRILCGNRVQSAFDVRIKK